jgi:hypothetical protein
MSESLIFAQDVSFNKTLTNITQILPVFTTDTITNINCTRLDFSGTLVANNMSCTNSLIVNNIYTPNASTYITINKPLQPSYTYNATTGTNVAGTIGYIYSSSVSFTGTISQNTWTNIIGTFPSANVVPGIYMSKLRITYKNTGNINSHPIKIIHCLGGGAIPPANESNNCFTACVYFQNNNDAYIYTHNTILTIGPNQTLNHYICIPNQLNLLIVSASIENNSYVLSLLKIA